jgi:2-succinyl-5-enolpyruvyl-6-hydroxy-3-cyclohexene-1-carboxylate synthase
MRVHLDERSAAFFALGVGKASRAPAAIVTTSGTAAANLLPAVVEAAQSEAPLIVLTADRPPRQRGADANQAIDQMRLYGTYPRAFHEVGPPSGSGPELRHLRALACRSVAEAMGPPSGPVHLNFPFDKPLEPTDGVGDLSDADPLAARGRMEGAAFVDVRPSRAAPDEEEIERLVSGLKSERGVIVAGPTPEAERVGPAARALSAATGFPLLADALSGGRFARADGAHVVAAYDLFLREESAAKRLDPAAVLRVGASPTSAALLDWLDANAGSHQVVIDPSGRWKDHGASSSQYLRADAGLALAALAERMPHSASEEWTRLWRTAESATLGALASTSGAPYEGDLWDSVLSAVPAGGAVFVSNSMPVRDLDAFGHPRDEFIHVLGNRGASGIDGIVSSAFGVASQIQGPVVCVLGDLAFFHDQNGLLWQREDQAHVVFVLVDNDGGGIFHMLPVAEHEPHFTPLVATPHGLDLRHAAELHGIGWRDAAIPELGKALAEALAAGRTSVVRVRTDRAANQRRRDEIVGSVRRSVREALG